MFKTNLLRILIGIAMLTTAAATAGTVAAQGSTTKVSFTYMTYIGKDSDQVGSLIDAYMKLNPNVTIDYQIVDHDALQQKLQTMVQTNTLPDMFWWNGQNIIDAFNQTHSVLDLTQYMDDAFKNTFIDGAFTNMTTADGKIVGFPA